jgi:hypothetical protein
VKVDHAALLAAASRADLWSSSKIQEPKSLWSMETDSGLLMTHGPGGWLIDSLSVEPSVGAIEATNADVNEPFSLCVRPSAFKALLNHVKFSRELDVSFPVVRGMRRLCLNSDDLQLVDPKAHLLDASRADEFLLEVKEASWTVRVGVQHLLNCLRPVALASADPELNKPLAKATLRFSEDMSLSAEATDGRILVRAEGFATFCDASCAELVLSTPTLNRLERLLSSVPEADTVTLSLVETELGGDASGQMLSVAFEETTVEALIYLDQTLQSADLSDLINAAKRRLSGDKASKNAEDLTSLTINRQTRQKLKSLSEECSQIMQLTTKPGGLTAIAQVDARDTSGEDDWFSSVPLTFDPVDLKREIFVNGPTLAKVLGLFDGLVRLRLIGCDPASLQRMKALVISHADECLPHIDALVIGLNLSK